MNRLKRNAKHGLPGRVGHSVVLLAITLAAASPLAAQNPTIVSATINYSTNPSQVTLSGQNFSKNGAAPTVTLNGSSLTLVSFNNQTIVATMPIGLAPGSYRMTVTNSQMNAVAFDLANGAIGPQGPIGLQGPPGPQGPAGPPATGDISVGNISASGNITSAGNIAASGNITAQRMYLGRNDGYLAQVDLDTIAVIQAGMLFPPDGTATSTTGVGSRAVTLKASKWNAPTGSPQDVSFAFQTDVVGAGTPNPFAHLVISVNGVPKLYISEDGILRAVPLTAGTLMHELGKQLSLDHDEADVSLSFSSLAPNSCLDVAASATGAQANDSVKLGLPSNLMGDAPGATFLGWVNAVGSVTVRACNATNTPIAAPGPYTITVYLTHKPVLSQ